jgi:hypothetical protein
MEEKLAQKDAHIDFFKSLAQLWETLITTMSDIFSLAVLETRLAGRSLVIILTLFLIMLFLLTTSWFFLMAAAAFWLTTLGLSWGLALLCVVGLNILSIVIGFLCILKLKQNLKFKATRKQLGF